MIRPVLSAVLVAALAPWSSARAEHVLLARQVGVPAVAEALTALDPDGQWAIVPADASATPLPATAAADKAPGATPRAAAKPKPKPKPRPTEQVTFGWTKFARGAWLDLDALGGVCADEVDVAPEPLAGVEPDEIDAPFTARLAGVEPDEIDAPFTARLAGVEPDEIDVAFAEGPPTSIGFSDGRDAWIAVALADTRFDDTCR